MTRYANRGRILTFRFCAFFTACWVLLTTLICRGAKSFQALRAFSRTSLTYAWRLFEKGPFHSSRISRFNRTKIISFYRKNFIPLGSFLTKWNRRSISWMLEDTIDRNVRSNGCIQREQSFLLFPSLWSAEQLTAHFSCISSKLFLYFTFLIVKLFSQFCSGSKTYAVPSFEMRYDLRSSFISKWVTWRTFLPLFITFQPKHKMMKLFFK